MTVALSNLEIAKQITAQFPDAVLESNNQAVFVKNEYLLNVLSYLKSSPEFDFNFLSDITATDYYDYFEIVYQLTSLKHNHKAVIKTRCADHEKPTLPSVTGLWRGADFMEREIFDLMGISFNGHPNLKRIFLWEGFTGHPLRKDFR